MPVTPANQTRLKILASIRELESFTVAELCLNANLTATRVYRELAELQKSGVLTSESIRPPGKGKASRPSKRYQLSADPSIREKFTEEIGAFFTPFEHPEANEHLRLAKQFRDELQGELSADLSKLNAQEFERWDARCGALISRAEKSIQRANWDSETDFSEGEHSQHPVIQTTRSIEHLRSRYEEIQHPERLRRNREAARPHWFKILIPAIDAILPGLETAHADMVALMSEQLSKTVSLGVLELARSPKLNAIAQYLDSLQLDLLTAESKSDLFAVLAKHFITYGNRIGEALIYARRLTEESKHYRYSFNEANLAHLACKKEEAFNSWRKYSSYRKLRANFGMRPLIARVGPKNWSLQAYEAVMGAITRDRQASVCAFAEASFGSPREHVIRPVLFNPILNESQIESLFIPLAEPLAAGTSLHVLSTEAESPLIAGLPHIARANQYLDVLPDTDAWRLAEEGSPEERVVKVEFFRAATPGARAQAANILTSELSATLVN